LAARDYSFLDGVPVSDYGACRSLGDEAAFFLGLHLKAASREAGRETEARAFLLIAQASPAPFDGMAMRELATTGSAAERLESAERYLGIFPPDGDVVVARARALFDLGRHREAVDAAVLPGLEPTRAQAAALESVRARALLAMGSPAARDALVSWYLDQPFGPDHAETLASLPESFPSNARAVALARRLCWDRAYAAAWPAARALLESGTSEAFRRAALSDLCKAALYGSADRAVAARVLDAAAATKAGSKGEAPYVLAFYAGRALAKGSGQELVAAIGRFDRAISLAPDGPARDDALWYLLDTALAIGTDRFLAEFTARAPGWSNPEGFSDLLDKALVELVSRRDRVGLGALWASLPDRRASEDAARVAYLAARFDGLDPADTEAALVAAFEGDHGSFYYRALAADRLGRALADPARSLFGARADGTRDGQSPERDDEERVERVLLSYVRYGLGRRVYSLLVAEGRVLSRAAAERVADELTKAGLVGESIRVMARTVARTGGDVGMGDLRLVYPRPWRDEVAAASRRFGVPEYLVYALARSESYFDPEVVSRAGAVGLTQLMPATAADVARRLRAADFDLKDPGTNIAFGAYYLAELARRLDGRWMPALFAYNAGITRVRQWRSAAGDLPDDLFLESLPFAETREYGRKVLAAAVLYGYLYYDKTPAEVVGELFNHPNPGE
jgi:soluble lytic murein transglycosylase